jgi:hypothetical protein
MRRAVRGHGLEGDDPAQDAVGLDVRVPLVDLIERVRLALYDKLRYRRTGQPIREVIHALRATGNASPRGWT